MSTQNLSKDILEQTSKTIAMLSADGVEKAQSGHPGMPMGMSDLASVVWLKYLKFNPQDPKWLARDRFVLSNGHGSMLLYSLLHLSGYDLTMNDLQQFRQWESRTPGHPENHMTAGVECTTGPLGQGISNSVGMAIGQKLLQSRYGESNPELFDHKVFVFCGDGCLMEGVSGEASSLAGHLGLGNIIVIYDDNHISIAGHTELSFTESVLKRYEAYGWHTQAIDGHNFDQIDGAIQKAIAVTDKPSIIAARTIIGKGSPNKADTHDVHGSPLGKAEMEATKKNLGWPQEPTFYIPDQVRSTFAARIEQLKSEYEKWKNDFSAWEKASPEKAKQLSVQVKRQAPADLQARLIKALPEKPAPISTRKLSGIVLNAASKEANFLIGGSADLEPSTLTLIDKSSDVEKGAFTGLNLRFGVREHGMGAIMNGLSYYGSFVPYGSTFLCFTDYMRPTIRLAALSHLPGLFIYTHDSIFLGEDGPTHQPIEHLQSLRMIPNLWVMRPADPLETAVCYTLGIERKDGPALYAFTRQNLDPIERVPNFDPNEIRKGGYVVSESGSGSGPLVVLVATGSEVPLACAAAKELSASAKVRVVSMPCYELFKAQSAEYREKIIPKSSRKVVIEAGATFGWAQMVGGSEDDTVLIGLDHYGASAPAKILAEKFGLTTASVVSRTKAKFKI